MLQDNKGFFLFSSNRLEILVEKVAEQFRRSGQDPFRKETVIVQSRGMARFLSLESARLNGISANVDYIFPNVFIDRYIGGLVSDKDRHHELSVYSPEVLSFFIFSMLPSFLKRYDFPEISEYIDEKSGQKKRLQLSQRIADLFDQYLLFRPDMIVDWEKGKEDHWQACLWRMIRENSSEMHRLDLFSAFKEKAKNDRVPPDHFPERIFIFGIPALPPFYMEVFRDVANFSSISMFLLTPCAEYWGDILNEKERFRILSRTDEAALPLFESSHGNRLLSSLGKVGRDFFELVQAYDIYDTQMFGLPDENSLLSFIQSDICNLVDPSDDNYKKRTVENTDNSIQIHCCHNALREVEVLEDRLYAMFAEDNDLTPGDVLVMMTDSDTYSPLVHAVFSRKPEGRDSIPYSVADRGFSGESSIARIFLSLLDMSGSRFTASEVLGMLEEDLVIEAFGLLRSDVEVISDWIEQANIRWGWDAHHRKKAGLPGFHECTWVEGFKRLLLGYALPDNDLDLFEGILPLGVVEGKTGEVLGAFLDYAHWLYNWVSCLEKNRTASEWGDVLLEALDKLFSSDISDDHDVFVIRDEIVNMCELMRKACVDEHLEFSVVRSVLQKKLETMEQGAGFITGGVTFCAMLPMRSIPFKVICVLGMNSSGYPRHSRRSGFDLMMKKPRPGDRNLRNDDRYLFLEALLSARKTFYISYTGRNEKDNSFIPPSVLVSELTDYIQSAFDLNGRNAVDRLILEHMLQPFSFRYFEYTSDDENIKNKGPHLFSFSNNNYRAALADQEHEEIQNVFFKNKIELPAAEELELTVDDLCNFFRNPAKYLLKNRLGIHLDKYESNIEDTEPFNVEGLDLYFLKEKAVNCIFNGSDMEKLHPWAEASGFLPVGRAGDMFFKSHIKKTCIFADTIKSKIYPADKVPAATDITISGIRISGYAGFLYNGFLVRYRSSSVKGKDLTDAWIRHLLISASDTAEYKGAVVFGTSKNKPVEGYKFDKPENPEEILGVIIDLFIMGMTSPLPFFPETSFAYYESLNKDNQPEKALKAASVAFNGDKYRDVPGDGEDPFIQLGFKGVSYILGTDFEKYTKMFFEQLFAHCSTLSEGDWTA